MSTIRDVSKLAGVSIATVSRVINKSGYVQVDTEKSVIKAMQKLNYEPSEIARSLAGKGTLTIALLVPDILNPFYPEIAKAVENEANALGYTVILCNSDNNPDKEERYFDLLEKKRIDGIILASYTLDASRLKKIHKKMPIVLVDNLFQSGQPFLSFVSKNREGGQMAVRHLLDQGCTKIAHICGPMNIHSAYERFLGYEDICKTQPWFIPSLVVQGDFQTGSAFQATVGLLERHPDINGIFACNDIMAVGALKALIAMGKAVPDDIKLVGFDGISLPLVLPELTTIAQPISEMGSQATRHLIDLINGKPLEHKAHHLDVRLLVRESSMSKMIT